MLTSAPPDCIKFAGPVLTQCDPFLTLGDMSLIRGTSLHGFIELVDELGGDAQQLLAQAGIRSEAIGDHDSFISARRVIAILESAAVATGTGDFGRQLASRQSIEILGPLGIAARAAETVGAALQSIERYLGVYSPALSVEVAHLPEARWATFTWAVTIDRPSTHRQAAELGLSVSVQIVRLLVGADFHPHSVHLRHEALVHPDDYTEYFGCPVEFSAETYYFSFEPELLNQRLSADNSMNDVIRDYLSTIAFPSEVTNVETVTNLIRRMLPTGSLDLDLVADHLAQHRRTVQRQLAAQGTSFAELVDQVRREEAERRLRQSDMPFVQLAGILGFTEQSAFSRACRRWFGAPPRDVRAGRV